MFTLLNKVLVVYSGKLILICCYKKQYFNSLNYRTKSTFITKLLLPAYS